MTEPSPPYTPEHKLGFAAELEQKRHELSETKQPQGSEYVTARTDRIIELTRRLQPEAPAAPAGPSWRERRAFRQEQAEMTKEMLSHPEESDTAKEIAADKIESTREFLDKAPAEPGYSWEDVERTPSAEQWTSGERLQFKFWAQSIGATPTEATALAGSWPGPETATTLPEIDWREKFGADYERKHRAFEKAMRSLGDDAYERAREAGVGRVPALVEKIIALGERMR